MTESSNAPVATGNHLIVLLFASIGAVHLLQAELLDAGIWLSLAAGIAALGSESNDWSNIPLWRRAVGIVLAVIAVGMIVARIAIDVAS